MEEKEVQHNGTQIQLLSINTEEIQNLYDSIVKNNIPIYRIKKDGTLVIIPPLKLNQFLGKDTGNIPFYIEKDWYQKNVSQQDKVSDELLEEIKIKEDFKTNLEKFGQMSVKERGDLLDSNIEKIRENIQKNKPIGTIELLDLVQSAINSYCLNKATLEENIKSLLSKENLQLVIEKTKLLVEAIVQFLQQERVNYNDLNELEKVKTESAILDHMHKVMLRFIPFCIFYNEYFTDGLIASFRARFKEKYLLHYQKLMPESDITLERVFLRGMRRLTLEEMKVYALGAIFHDIGKVPDVQYSKWDEGYDKATAIKHAAYGFKLVMATKELPLAVSVMSALHHEYYNSPDGYNLYKIILPRYEELLNSKSIDYIITYDVKDLLSYQALSFFPCKVLEIIDLFDDLITEKYGQDNFLSISDILAYMKENYIEKNMKIDPIIFSIFIEFARLYEGLPDPDAVKHLRF